MADRINGIELRLVFPPEAGAVAQRVVSRRVYEAAARVVHVRPDGTSVRMKDRDPAATYAAVVTLGPCPLDFHVEYQPDVGGAYEHPREVRYIAGAWFGLEVP